MRFTNTWSLRALRARVVILLAGALSVGIGGHARAELIFGATQQNMLLSWERATPSTLANQISITGLSGGERINGMDFRQSDGQLYAVTTSSRVYTIDTASGAATLVATIAGGSIGGNHWAFDFDQVADQIRIVSDNTQNVRVNPLTGAVTNDTNVAYVVGDPGFGSNPGVINLATNAQGVVYGIDASSNTVVILNSPNAGSLMTVGSLGISIHKSGGFDIAALDGLAFAALRSNGGGSTSAFYQINLATGQATLIGQIGVNHQVRAMAIAIPSPGTVALLGCSLLLVSRPRGRRKKIPI